MEKKRKLRKRKSPRHYILGGVVWALVGSIAGTATYAHLTKNDSQVSTVNDMTTECKIPCKRLHCSMNKDGYVTYLPREEKEINGFIKQDIIKQVFFDSDIEFANKLFENGFVVAEDNRPLIEYIEGTTWESKLDGYDDAGNPIYKCAGFYAFQYNSDTDTFVRSDYTASVFNINEEYPYIKINGLYDMISEDKLNEDFQSFFEDDGGDVFDNYDEWFGDESDNQEMILSVKHNKQKTIGARNC